MNATLSAVGCIGPRMTGDMTRGGGRGGSSGPAMGYFSCSLVRSGRSDSCSRSDAGLTEGADGCVDGENVTGSGSEGRGGGKDSREEGVLDDEGEAGSSWSGLDNWTGRVRIESVGGKFVSASMVADNFSDFSWAGPVHAGVLLVGGAGAVEAGIESLEKPGDKAVVGSKSSEVTASSFA